MTLRADFRLPLRLACLGAALALSATCQKLPDLYSGEWHGDPPYLSQPGWRPLLDGAGLAGWHGQDGKPHGWIATRAVAWRRIFNPTHLEAAAGPGDRILNGAGGRAANLVSDGAYGDVELFLEFMVAKGSNSGVYLHGLYEVQIFDSFGFNGPLVIGDCGGIYQREGVGDGAPPLRNASRAPGEWQSFHIWFRAPRFDASGRKTENARFLRVLLNDTLVQENVEAPGPTQSHMDHPEAARNPLMLQGDHGPVAFRNIYIRPLEAGPH
jgi:hypothetical protein